MDLADLRLAEDRLDQIHGNGAAFQNAVLSHVVEHTAVEGDKVAARTVDPELPGLFLGTDRSAAGADDDLVAGIQRFPDGGAVSFGDLTRVIQQCAVQIKKDCFCFHLVTPVPILRYD